jgi:hypothetical protein
MLSLYFFHWHLSRVSVERSAECRGTVRRRTARQHPPHEGAWMRFYFCFLPVCIFICHSTLYSIPYFPFADIQGILEVENEKKSIEGLGKFYRIRETIGDDILIEQLDFFKSYLANVKHPAHIKRIANITGV